MDCSRIPPAVLWKEATPQQLEQYRLHVRTCRKCRSSVLHQGPDLLLQELSDLPLPQEFWLGFWDSLHHKIVIPQRNKTFALRAVRWVAVFIFVWMLAYAGKSPEPVRVINSERSVFEEQYPIVEEIENHSVTTYVFQGTGGETVVLLFDAEIDL